MLVKIRHRADQYREVGLSPAIVAHCWRVSRYQSRRAARNPRHLRHVLRHGEAHAAKGLTAFGTSLTRNSLFLRATGLIRSGCNGCGQRFRWQDLTCGQAKPVFKARLAEWRAIAWKECVLAKLHAVVG